jgi:hypothetical protein
VAVEGKEEKREEGAEYPLRSLSRKDSLRRMMCLVVRYLQVLASNQSQLFLLECNHQLRYCMKKGSRMRIGLLVIRHLMVECLLVVIHMQHSC